MEYTEHYDNLAEREQFIATAENNKYRMLHDTFDAGWKRGDEPHGILTFTDEMPASLIPEPPYSTHLARVIAIDPDKEKPATVVRIWNSKDYTYDCYVTENVKDQWLAGDIVVGDFVLVHFIEGGEKVIVIAKVLKTW